MRLTDLKIKRLTLAAEARIIKRHENAALEKARVRSGIVTPKQRRNMHRSLVAMGILPDSAEYAQAMTGLKIQAQRMKSNKPTDKLYDAHYNLRQHRITVVRDAARAAHLANAYLKGTPYAKVEQPKYDSVVEFANIVTKVLADVTKFGGLRAKDVNRKHIDNWVDGGETHWQLAEAQIAKNAAKTAVPA